MNIAPIDIASIVASLTTIGVALSARPKSEGKEADGSNYEAWKRGLEKGSEYQDKKWYFFRPSKLGRPGKGVIS